MAKSKKAVGVSTGEKVGIGVALTTAAVAAAGAYFLYSSPNAAKNRKKVKGWMLKAKGEMLEVLEKAGKMTAEEYQQALDAVAAGYSHLQNASKADIAEFKKEMMSNWQKIAKQAAPAKKAAKKAVKKVVKEAKKAVK
ncbi:hypothetical protein A2392_02995 [Candidatus Kaiserbacteria bacterium RIFOXYB1_FULL_46_14]|uniref:Uncharacterized protein n=1 Tax=Candidatus Kaiserbacteria bacterium RIFOXYB1_FULL_46_14 TaxID=1798531 RepID=A0A1F6FIQ3_9BACT|nr:MAG: hypothetical protein A2392_02995 [Candidatus Kaiserbacteria bacterium RIFOXYB1_FULL_46_14]